MNFDFSILRESENREAFIIQDDTGGGQWYYWVEGVPHEWGGAGDLGGPFASRGIATDKLYNSWGSRVNGHVTTNMSQWKNNAKPGFYAAIMRAREQDEWMDEDGADMMPRKNQHIDRAEALNMKMADELFQTSMSAEDNVGEMADPNSFEEIAGKPKQPKQRRMYECGCQAMNQDPQSQMAMVADMAGNIMQVSAGDDTDYQLDKDWLTDANQEFMDRTSKGERWIEVVNDLARRFAEFFDGSYEAFDFAADAFGRRAWEMGITEAQLMAEEFDRSGVFRMPSEIPVFEAKYQGREVTLNKPTRNDGGDSQMKVYVNSGKKNKDGTIKVKKVTFGDSDSKIKKSDPERRKSFRARHKCDNPGPKTKARYWSCRAW